MHKIDLNYKNYKKQKKRVNESVPAAKEQC